MIIVLIIGSCLAVEDATNTIRGRTGPFMDNSKSHDVSSELWAEERKHLFATNCFSGHPSLLVLVFFSFAFRVYCHIIDICLKMHNIYKCIAYNMYTYG